MGRTIGIITGFWLALHGVCLGQTDTPQPPPRPPEFGAPATEPPDPPVSHPGPPPRPVSIDTPGGGGEAAPSADPDDVACRRALTELGVSFSARPPLNGEGECGAEAPLAVAAIGAVAVPGDPVMVCPMAEALARWVKDSVEPRAREHLQQPLRAVHIGTSYQCRSQRSGTKLSEHAFANAIDISAFTVDARAPVPVKPTESDLPEGRFLAAVRAGACAHFTTVLGPGTADHDDHFHFDLRGRRGSFKLCQ